MIIEILLSWMVLSVAVGVAAGVLGGFRVDSAGGIVVVAAMFGVLNHLLGWLLFGLVFGVVFVITPLLALLFAFLVRWFVDAVFLKAVDGMSDSISIDGFGTAFVAALIIAFVGSVGEWMLGLMGLATYGA